MSTTPLSVMAMRGELLDRIGFHNNEAEKFRGLLEKLNECWPPLDSTPPAAATASTKDPAVLPRHRSTTATVTRDVAQAEPADKRGHNQKAHPIVGGKRVCNKCGEPKLLEEFPKNESCKLGRAGTCIECNRKRAAANYQKQQLEKKTQARKSDLRPDIPAEQKSAVQAEQKSYTCGCGKSFRAKYVFEDHQKKCPQKPYCKLCRCKFQDQAALKAHNEERHSNLDDALKGEEEYDN